MNKGMNAKRDFQTALAAGDAFHSLAFQHINEIRLSGDVKNIGILSASATNLALAVELYLKALHVACGRAPQSLHDLSALFKQLPLAEKRLASAVYECLPGPKSKNEVSTFIVDVFVNNSEPSFPKGTHFVESVPENSLIAVLKRSRDAFLTWRYLYEQGDERKTVKIEYEFFALSSVAMAIKALVLAKLYEQSNLALPDEVASLLSSAKRLLAEKNG